MKDIYYDLVIKGRVFRTVDDDFTEKDITMNCFIELGLYPVQKFGTLNLDSFEVTNFVVKGKTNLQNEIELEVAELDELCKVVEQMNINAFKLELASYANAYFNCYDKAHKIKRKILQLNETERKQLKTKFSLPVAMYPHINAIKALKEEHPEKFEYYVTNELIDEKSLKLINENIKAD